KLVERATGFRASYSSRTDLKPSPVYKSTGGVILLGSFDRPADSKLRPGVLLSVNLLWDGGNCVHPLPGVSIYTGPPGKPEWMYRSEKFAVEEIANQTCPTLEVQVLDYVNASQSAVTPQGSEIDRVIASGRYMTMPPARRIGTSGRGPVSVSITNETSYD